MKVRRKTGPQRIVCLTEETTETLYLLGEEDRIVGISGFTVRPPRARREKPKVSAFTSAKIERIVALRPDLVLGFSDLQAGIAAELIRAGIEVHVFNQRSVQEILDSIAMLGRMIGAHARTRALIGQLRGAIDAAQQSASRLPCRPRVYFEEWDEPLICAIRWVGELMEIAGAENCFADLSTHPAAKERIITDPLEVVRRAPDVLIASWCGKKFNPAKVRARPGWEAIPALRCNRMFEIKSSEILQPGPAALTDGLNRLGQIIADSAYDMQRKGGAAHPSDSARIP